MIRPDASAAKAAGGNDAFTESAMESQSTYVHFFDDLSVFIPFFSLSGGLFLSMRPQQFLGAAPNSSSPPPRRDLGISLGISDRMVGFGSFFVGFCSRFSAQIWPG